MSDSSWGFAPGDEITPDLVTVKLLGGGSAYEAYLAFDEITYGPVVVKVVRPDQVADEHSLRGLRREVQALATVNHPVVVRGLRHELEGERPHVVLEQIDGPRLSSLIRRHGRLPEQQYLPLAIELAGALHYLRRLGLDPPRHQAEQRHHGRPGPAHRPVGGPDRSRPPRPSTTEIGTDAYMAPEQCTPGRPGRPGPASDVWGLGATRVPGGRRLPAVRPRATGRPSDRELRYPQLVDPPYELPDGTPHEVAKILFAALEPDPADRPLPHELAEALEPVMARQPKARFAGFSTR